MKRQIAGLNDETALIEDGYYLVSVQRAWYHYDRHKPYYQLRFVVAEPKSLASSAFCGRIYCGPKAIWMLRWFLSDFGYDAELLRRGEVDDKALVNLRGVVKVSHSHLNGRSWLNLDRFAPVEKWDEVAALELPVIEVRRDL